jgi:hypothetical protein
VAVTVDLLLLLDPLPALLAWDDPALAWFVQRDLLQEMAPPVETLDPTDPQVAQGLNWFRTHQSVDGLWETGYGSGPRAGGMRRWVGLAICRVLLRFKTLGVSVC